MHDFEKVNNLEKIAEELFEDTDMTFTWQVEQPADEEPKSTECCTGCHSDVQNAIAHLKEKLDILSVNFSKADDIPNINFIEALLITELQTMTGTINSHITAFNNAINMNQCIAQANCNSTPALISIPLN